MTEVYVVTEGWYEGDHVYGVFSTQEKADEFISTNPELFSDPSVDEWALDDTDESPND